MVSEKTSGTVDRTSLLEEKIASRVTEITKEGMEEGSYTKNQDNMEINCTAVAVPPWVKPVRWHASITGTFLVC